MNWVKGIDGSIREKERELNHKGMKNLIICKLPSSWMNSMIMHKSSRLLFTGLLI